MNRYPELWQFFNVFLGPDWPEEYANEWAALDDYIHDDPGALPAFCGEVQALLADHPSEEGVRHILFEDFQLAYLAEVNGWKYRDWLQALSDHVEKAVGHPRAS